MKFCLLGALAGLMSAIPMEIVMHGKAPLWAAAATAFIAGSAVVAGRAAK